MDSLVASWVKETAEMQEGAIVGNSSPGWDDFDTTVSPFIIGALGESGWGRFESTGEGDRSEFELSDEEVLDAKKEKLFKRMNTAMEEGDEAGALGLMKKINAISATDEDDGTDDSTFDLEGV